MWQFLEVGYCLQDQFSYHTEGGDLVHGAHHHHGVPLFFEIGEGISFDPNSKIHSQYTRCSSYTGSDCTCVAYIAPYCVRGGWMGGGALSGACRDAITEITR